MQALHDGVGLVVRLEREGLDLIGVDRVRYLNNLVTCDVKALTPGQSARGFVTHIKGGVIADADLLALEDRYRLVLPAGRGEAVAAHLLKYRVVERVEILPRPDLERIGLRGARAPELLAALTLPAPEVGTRVVVTLAGVAVSLRRETRRGAPRFELEVAAVDSDAVVVALRTAGERLGLTELSVAALELARIENLELAWGIDYGGENFPQEIGDDDAVSYTKGCYLGQEVVARIHYRGGVQRLPRRLSFAAGAHPERGIELLFEGRAVGRVSTLATDPANGRLVGLALVHRRASAPGTRLDLAGGGAAEVATP